MGDETMNHATKPGRLAASQPGEEFLNGQPDDSSAEVYEEVDPRITYPCYKSFDEFIDTAWLRSLDGYITEGVRRRARAHQDIRFYTGPHRLQAEAPDVPGSRMIYLAQSKLPDSYFDLDKTWLWEPTPAAEEFSELMDFIATLPFKATGRMLIMYDEAGRAVTAHRDHDQAATCHDFVWFRTNLRKPFYVLNHRTNEKLYVESYSAWFDTVNQFHGGDASDGLSFSIRVDGHFTDDFRARIPRPASNAASTPALWACLKDV
jgi:hypothetical protein